MASMERKHEHACPFIMRNSASKRTSAEIVSEARQYLRTLHTQRPFTPRDGHRHLFGESSAHVNSDGRPPSTFSLHARNFDAPDSRPGSGIRLSPLDYKPKLVAPYSVEEPVKAHPKPPCDPLEVKRGAAAGARARFLRTSSLTTLPPTERSTEEKKRSTPAQRQQSAKGEGRTPPDTDHTELHSGPPKTGPHRTANEGRPMRPDVDLPVTEWGAGLLTGLGNGESTASRKEDAQSAVRNDKILPLLQELESLAAGRPEDSVDRLCDLCNHLHVVLAEQNMLGRRCDQRAGILRTLFRLIDLNSAQLSLHIAKLCLALCVSGNNLLNICKLVFKISRSECNDVLFQNNSIIDSLLGVLCTEDVCASGEALLYCVGSLKFLSGNTTLLGLLLAKSFMSVAQQLIQRLYPLSKPGHIHFTMAGHILVQLTATLRNLADHPKSHPLFVSHSLLSELCMVLQHHDEDEDICTNIARIYSILSSYSECCLALTQTPGCYQLFIELLSKHKRKQDLVVRLLFTLGNLTAKSDEARERLFRCQGCVDTLLRLYRRYQWTGNSHTRRPVPEKAPRPADKPCTPAAGSAEAEDVLVKLVRVVANMCIHPAAGLSLACDAACTQLLVETLELRSVPESKELLVNVAATINNLSFYQADSSAVRQKQLSIAKLVLKLLLCCSSDAVLEAVRVYGNLSQSKAVRDFIMQNKVYQFVVALLDSESYEVCFSACGVLTNLALDPPNRVTLSLEGAAVKLTDCLRDFAPWDWQLAGQVCQTLWNLTESSGPERDLLVMLGTKERETLLELLTAYSDEAQALQWMDDVETRDFHRACWEMEFLPVAQKLKNRLHLWTD
ncbi:armadillo repeat-containing protein 2 [Lampris incognitus]|uniref:armadillo repeat-containing protein 2 n=1 Tax=Lampris incognitus TaxID=2546036 RepID=UPI0024B4CCBB|nr:armadillo repeat-containing protein 2 [Lampris incognitus]